MNEDPSQAVLVVFPSAEDLSSKRIHNRKKRSKKQQKDTGNMQDKIPIYRYHCPFHGCKYFERMFFANIKFLRQHYRKVHMKKHFVCAKCQKAFALQSLLKSHVEMCGVTFKCACGVKYNNLEALLMHTKRKQACHGGLTSRDIKRGLRMYAHLESMQQNGVISENNSLNTVYTTVGVGNSVDPLSPLEVTCKQTQTALRDSLMSPRTTSQTQTYSSASALILNKDCVLKDVMTSTEHQPDLVTSSSATQTPVSGFVQLPEQLSTETFFANDYFVNNVDLEESVGLHNLEGITSVQSLLSTEDNRWCTTETQTEVIDLDTLLDSLLDTESNFGNYLNSGTQTPFTEYLERSFADTETQTCDKLFSDFDFVDIETQTPWSWFDDLTFSTCN